MSAIVPGAPARRTKGTDVGEGGPGHGSCIICGRLTDTGLALGGNWEKVWCGLVGMGVEPKRAVRLLEDFMRRGVAAPADHDTALRFPLCLLCAAEANDRLGPDAEGVFVGLLSDAAGPPLFWPSEEWLPQR